MAPGLRAVKETGQRTVLPLHRWRTFVHPRSGQLVDSHLHPFYFHLIGVASIMVPKLQDNLPSEILSEVK